MHTREVELHGYFDATDRGVCFVCDGRVYPWEGPLATKVPAPKRGEWLVRGDAVFEDSLTVPKRFIARSMVRKASPEMTMSAISLITRGLDLSPLENANAGTDRTGASTARGRAVDAE